MGIAVRLISLETTSTLSCAENEININAVGASMYGCNTTNCCSEMCATPTALSFFSGAQEGSCATQGFAGEYIDTFVQPPGSPYPIAVRLISLEASSKSCHCHSYEQIECSENDPLYEEHILEIETYCADLLGGIVNVCPYKCFQPIEVLHLHYLECPDRPVDATYIKVNATGLCHNAGEAPENTNCPKVEEPTTMPSVAPSQQENLSNLDGAYKWKKLTSKADWSARAGLEVVQLDNLELFVIGGQIPKPPSIPFIPGDSIILGDVWKSSDFGKTWNKILNSGDSFPPRAYFEAVVKNNTIFVLGGQNFDVVPNPQYSSNTLVSPFIDNTKFFNDVWSSNNGINWSQLTESAGWKGRAGHSAIVFQDSIFLMGGSTGNDDSIVGQGLPERSYFNDVWKTNDGIEWTLLTENAPWAPRAGAALVVFDGYIYILGGEVGFIGFPPPYFNDVWKTQDGITWELVTNSTNWSPRPGHLCHNLYDRIICFGGFGQSEIPGDFTPSNPMDCWESEDGKDWSKFSARPWRAKNPADIKYDFDSIVVKEDSKESFAIYTFGGDRETFDFSDNTQYLNIDNDVWRFGKKPKNRGKKQGTKKPTTSKPTKQPKTKKTKGTKKPTTSKPTKTPKTKKTKGTRKPTTRRPTKKPKTKKTRNNKQ